MNAFKKTAFAALAVASIMGGLAGTGAANAAQRTAAGFGREREAGR